MDWVSFRVNRHLSRTIEDTLPSADLIRLNESVVVLPFPRIDNSPFHTDLLCCASCLSRLTDCAQLRPTAPPKVTDAPKLNARRLPTPIGTRSWPSAAAPCWSAAFRGRVACAQISKHSPPLLFRPPIWS